MMTRTTALIISLLLAIGCHASEFRFGATGKPVISIVPETSSGLKSVYVAYTTQGLTVSYEAASDATVTWYTFGPEGAAYAERLSEGAELSELKGGRGYIAEVGNRREYFWLIDYSDSPFDVTGISVADNADCSAVEIKVEGSAPRLTYTALNGRQIELDRQITLSYLTLKTTDNHFEQIQTSEDISYLRSTVHAEAPLCATRFTLTGDRFLKEWGLEKTVESDAMSPRAVSAITSATPEVHDSPNEQTGPIGEIGGSAPLTVSFSAQVTDAALFTEWQVATDEEFNDVTLRDRSTEFVYTFSEAGNFFVKFTAADTSGDCLWESDTYRVGIGESRLLCPNVFSPGASEGVNDIWCVSYRSIIEFDCSIFNRWGVRMIRFTDPSQGWDGRYKGRLVDPGVYYYVITARGADGKNYNLSGDINIVGYR